MKVLALIEAPGHVCYRYRIEAFAWALAERGLHLEAAPLCRGVWPRWRQIAAARRADLVVLQRKLLPIWQLCALRRAAKALVYDFDDAVFRRDSYHRKPSESWQRLGKFWATVYAADLVVAGNAHLRDRAAAYVEPARVCVIPTCVEPGRYAVSPHDRAGRPARLVWIGQRSTLASLDCVRRHLAAAARVVAGLELRVICDALPELEGVRCLLRPWTSATEAEDLTHGDIGISWLPDDAWSRGKCGLKVLQYMAAGLPVVANRVGMHRDMVIDGRTGFLADTPAEWAAAIRRLAGDPSLRRTMGAAGRRLVEERFSVDRWGPRLAALLRGAAEAAKPRAGASGAETPGPRVAVTSRRAVAARPFLTRPAARAVPDR